MQSEDETISTIKHNAELLFVDLKTCALPNIEILREASVPDAKFLFMLKFVPLAFNSNRASFRQFVEEVKKMGFNPSRSNFVLAVHALKSMSKSTWGKKVEVYKKWCWSEDDILVAFEKHPWCMTASEHKIMRVMDFFVNKMVYYVLLSRGSIKNNDTTLATMLKDTEKGFLRRLSTVMRKKLRSY
ncbi:hypothetical protein ACSBR2_031294 [Camellia fascicularis]